MPQFQSFNFRDRFIRHRNFEGILSRKQDGGPEADFSFALVRRGPGRVALRSANFPDHFLRHANFRIFLGKSSWSWGSALPVGLDILLRDWTGGLERGLLPVGELP